MLDAFNTHSRFNRGLCLIYLNRSNDSLKEFKKILILNDTDPEGWYGQGRALYNLRRYNESIYSLKEAIEINQSDARVWFYLADDYCMVNKCNNASDAFSEGIKFYNSSLNGNHSDKYLEFLKNESTKLLETCK